MANKQGKKDGILATINGWISDNVIGEIPHDLAYCEFDCPKSQCSRGEWTDCVNRLRFVSLRNAVK